LDAVSVLPSTADPLTLGSAVFAGAGGCGGGSAATVPVVAEDAFAEPTALLAVTTTRTVLPTSLTVSA